MTRINAGAGHLQEHGPDRENATLEYRPHHLLHALAAVLDPPRRPAWLLAGTLALALAAMAVTCSIAVRPPSAVAQAAPACSGHCGPQPALQPQRSALHAAAILDQPADARADHALALQAAGRYDEAETLLRDALALRREAFGDRSPEVAGTLARLGMLLDEDERYSEAEQATRQALEVWQGLHEPEPRVLQRLQLQMARSRCHRRHGTGSPACDLGV